MRKSSSDWLFYIGRLMDAAHSVAQGIWVRTLYLTGALWWAKRELRRSGAIVVFTFHRILDDRSFEETDSLPFIVVRKRTFQRLVRYVAEHFEPVDVRTAEPGPVTERLRVAFTMDDGWQDNYVNALPILRAAEIPATVFLCTGLAGETAPFWPEQVRRVLRPSLSQTYGKRAETLIEALVESLKYCSPEARDRHVHMLLIQSGDADEMRGAKPRDIDRTLDWEQVREMDRQGVRFGSHSHAHPILTAVPEDVAAQEIVESKLALETKLGYECDLFAYPNGDWSPAIREKLAECGFRLAFTTEREAWLLETDLLSIPRAHIQQEDLVGIGGTFSAPMFEYATVWKIWLAMRRAKTLTAKSTTRALAVSRETA
jgi:peptidoglycan/xylan/chitin deacetylase (PgdA/CDA1 family)